MMIRELECGVGFGRPVRSITLDHVRVTESVYEERFEVPPHDHALPGLSIVLEGGYEERYRSNRINCEAGTTVYHTPGDPHSDHFGATGGRCLDITIDSALFGNHPSAQAELERRSASRLVLPRSRLFRIRHAMWQGDQVALGILQEYTLVLMGELLELPGLRVGADPPSWLERVRERVHREFAHPPGLVSLAKEAGVHRVHLARAFCGTYGCTVGEYIRLRKISAAAGALGVGRSSLSRIAYKFGFSDQSHFTRTFRDLVGMTPGVFRRRFAPWCRQPHC